MLAGDVGNNTDPDGEPHPDVPAVTVTGVKWEDTNANGMRDRGERGVPGVTIYSDLNGNGVLDDTESSTVTRRDNPDTLINEAGTYELAGLEPGMHFIREVVPRGFEQTFPGIGPHPFDPAGDDEPMDPTDGFATVHPEQIIVNLESGEPFVGEVSLTIHPVCFRPFEVDVVSSDPDIEVINESGVQLNGCGGDTTTFQVVVFGHEMSNREFELQFVDAEFGGVLATIPVHLTRAFDGAHIIDAPHGGFFAGIDFGNIRRFEAGSVHGHKWRDDNGNGVQDEGEEGLPGVRIYSDLNGNGVFDRHEPNTISMLDYPDTEEDEGGRYWLEGLHPGRHVIREVVPRGFEQTFPGLTSVVVSSETGRFHPGVAIDLDITGASIAPDTNAPAVDLELTVVWPDSCGELISDLSVATMVGDTILVSLHGHQVGDGCAEVISPQTETVRVPSLDLRHYDVVVTLNEDLRDGATRATLNAVGAIALGGFGAHVVQVEPGQTITGKDFGNRPLPPGSVHGTKWVDENGNGVRDDDEPGLPGVTIYADLNHNGQFDEDEPHAVTMEDFNDDLIDDNGKYWLEGLEPGHYVIREVVPEGYIQTFPLIDIFFSSPFDPDAPLPPLFGGAHRVWLTNGQVLTDIDFGNQPIRPASVHGTKWVDENGNGVRDDNEPGLPGVTIYADLNHNGQLDEDEPQTVTMEDFNDDLIDDNGKYWLEGLQPGHYVVREVVPDGFVQTYPQDFFFDGLGIPFPFGEGAHYVWLENGQVLTGIDFGNQRDVPGSVHGVKWLDENGNGVRDEGEPGWAGVTVYSDLNNNGQLDENEPRAVTMEDNDLDPIDDTGKYWLEGLSSGVHVIREIVPDGFVQTFPEHLPLPLPFEPGPDGNIWIDPYGAHVIFLGPGQVVDGINFGNRRFEPASVHGVKWLDRNGNGQRDPDEPGLPEVIIYSDVDMDGMFSDWEPHTVTMFDDPATADDEEGHYWLEGLDPGGHVIREVIPEGYVQTYPPFEYWPGPIGEDGQPINDFPVPIPPPNDDGGHWVWLEVGDRREDMNFGNRPQVEFARVHGRKWVDRNGDGDRDDNEPGLPGVTIYADANLNNRFDPGEPHAVTMRDDRTTSADETGLYRLDGIEPGLALIREVVPDGFEQTFPEILLCEATFCVGRAHMLNLEPGQVEDGIHFGNEPIEVAGGSIHGLKWNDVNGNGRRDDNEPGLPGVTVYIDLNNNGVLDNNEPRTETMRDNPDTRDNEAGRYWLQNLPPGRHIVREVVPRGFVQTFPQAGGARIIDSISVKRDPIHALGFDLVAVEQVPSADGTFGTDLVFSVTWPDPCGLIESAHEIDEAGRIHVQMSVMHNPLADCLAVISELTHTVHVGALPTGDHDVRATLHDRGLDQVAYVVEAKFVTGGDGYHVVVLEPGDVVDGVNFGNQPIARERGSIHGLKWNDLNGNGRRDDNEAGLPGVTVYLDLNNNGVLDNNEPRALTMRDDPNTHFNEAGRYWLEELPAGRHVVREVVPRGFVQTFPHTGGARIIESVSIERDPVRALGFELSDVEQVVSANGTLGTDLIFTVTWGNPCGLIESTHEIDEAGRIHVQMHVADDPSAFCPQVVSELSHTVHVGALPVGEHGLRAVLRESNREQVSYVVEARFATGGDGHHVVVLEPGDAVEGINFGNQPVDAELGSLHGRKWSDRNGNGQRDHGEPGLPGVTIWLDANLNGFFDSTDPRTRTMRDNPDTDFDEAGLYWFDGLEAGFYVIREVVPEGFEPTYPDPFFCRAIFCNGHGHMVTLEPGDNIERLDFGNQPIGGEAGAIEGFKWLDRNGNGQIDEDEPGLPGVTIYLDLNDNGELDRNEPHTESQFDDPNTRINEAGHYSFDMVIPGEYVVREVLRDGLVQTFPRDGFVGHIVESFSIPREPEAVLDFQLIEAGESITAEGVVGIGLTYLLHHEGALCAPIFESGARVDADGRIHVEMVARPNPGDVLCADEPAESTHTVLVSGVGGGRFEVRAELFEGFGERVRLSFVNEGVIEVGRGNGGHTVVVEAGQTVEGVRFGNRRDGIGPAQAIWDGEAAVGTSGDGATWEDPENWSVDGEPDHMPPEDDQGSAGAHVILAPGHGETIHVGAHHVLHSLRFMDDYHLVGDRMTITDDVEVDAGVVGTLEIALDGPVTKSGTGTLILMGEAGDVTVSAGVLGGAASLGHLRVEDAATVSPGTSPGVLNVASASFAPTSTLAIEIEGTNDLQHDALVSNGSISLDGTLAVTLMDGFDELAPGQMASMTILEGGLIDGRFANPSGWHHLDRGVFYQVSYGETSVLVDLWQALPGDANGDGMVDATDLNRWSENRFTFGDFVHGDFNNDHAIDGSDFNLWVENRFERAAGTAAARSARIPRAAAAMSAPSIVPWSHAVSEVSSYEVSSDDEPRAVRLRPNVPSDPATVVDQVIARELDRSLRRRSHRMIDLPRDRSLTDRHADDDRSTETDGDEWSLDVDAAFSELGL